MNATKPHLIVMQLDSGWVNAKLVCPGVEAGACGAWEETGKGCTCECDGCKDEDHGVQHGWIEPIGYECQCEETGTCWAMDEYMVEEMLGKGPWPTDEYPVQVWIQNDGGSPVLRPWATRPWAS